MNMAKSHVLKQPKINADLLDIEGKIATAKEYTMLLAYQSRPYHIELPPACVQYPWINSEKYVWLDPFDFTFHVPTSLPADTYTILMDLHVEWLNEPVKENPDPALLEEIKALESTSPLEATPIEQSNKGGVPTDLDLISYASHNIVTTALPNQTHTVPVVGATAQDDVINLGYPEAEKPFDDN